MDGSTDDPLDLTRDLNPPLPGAMRWLYRARRVMKLPFAQWFKKPSQAEKQLLVMCRGDREQLERLIRLEIAKNPERTREFASQAAIDRWTRGR